MKIIVIKTDSNIEVKNLEGNIIKEMKDILGGYLEAVRPREAYKQNLMLPRTLFCCDEEGLCKNKNFNLIASILYNGNLSPLMQLIVGDILIVGEDGEDFRSLCDGEVNHYLNVLAAMKQASLNFMESAR
ncbi:DUF3846 domain-containing protein [Clostridium polynesiense]|uniref:DUF3846 domain-containing protein n=1 Tax=Clostridium polynesiense TaxID=1325933 RepID=UPI000590ECF1|nr:DUF3846 domain-containing protein [Clostridium polynesiense]